MDSSLSRGFWILHNNLFFPPFREKNFVEPGGKVWKETTIGDTTDNVFYICISAGSVITNNSNPILAIENEPKIIGWVCFNRHFRLYLIILTIQTFERDFRLIKIEEFNYRVMSIDQDNLRPKYPAWIYFHIIFPL